MDEAITYWDLERNCPKDCPFLRKLKDKHIYLCVEYRLFLENDKYGIPRKSGKCGTKEVDNAKETLKKLSEQLDNVGPDVLTRDDNALLRNIMAVLDKSERETVATILDSPDLAQSFIKAFERQPKDHELVSNIRAVITEYEEKYVDKQKKQNRSRPEENKSNEETDEKLRLKALIEKMREKNGRNGL